MATPQMSASEKRTIREELNLSLADVTNLGMAAKTFYKSSTPSCRTTQTVEWTERLYAVLQWVVPCRENWPQTTENRKKFLKKLFDGPAKGFWAKNSTIASLEGPVQTTLQQLQQQQNAQYEEVVHTTMEELIAATTPRRLMSWQEALADSNVLKKLSEGSSQTDVFKAKRGEQMVVLKMIPLSRGHGDGLEPASRVINELRVAKSLEKMAAYTSAFVVPTRSVVVRGIYPNQLLQRWYQFQNTHQLEAKNRDPAELFDYPGDGRYLLVEFPFAPGKTLDKIRDALSEEEKLAVFAFVAFSVASAERVAQLEHRDLGASNIIVCKGGAARDDALTVTVPESLTDAQRKRNKRSEKLKNYWIPGMGLKVAIIDFGLSGIYGRDRRRIGVEAAGKGDPDDCRYINEWLQAVAHQEQAELLGEDPFKYRTGTNRLWLLHLSRVLFDERVFNWRRGFEEPNWTGRWATLFSKMLVPTLSIERFLNSKAFKEALNDRRLEIVDDNEEREEEEDNQ